MGVAGAGGRVLRADSVTWRTGLLQAGGAVLYFGTNAFLPTFLHAAGHPDLVAPCLAALNTSQLAAAFIVAILARRGASSHALLAVCGAFAIVGLAGIVFDPAQLAIAGSARCRDSALRSPSSWP